VIIEKEKVRAGVADVAGPIAAAVARLGLTTDSIVGEFGYDDDIDFDLREAIEAAIGTDLLDEEADDVLDAVVLWWRADDGDLTDSLVDAVTSLAEGGAIWVLTPKTGRGGFVPQSDVVEAAQIAGLASTSSFSAGPAWSMTKLVRPRSETRNRR
jgi:Protein of unknown function (DUF3052)